MRLYTSNKGAIVRVGDLGLYVTQGGKDFERRTIYRYRIFHDDGSIDNGTLHTGVDLDPGPKVMLRTLANLLTAAAESSPDGENADLFPEQVVELADVDQLSMLALGIEEGRL